MKLIKKEIEFIKTNRQIIIDILKKRREEYYRMLLDEEDEVKSKAVKLWIREFENAINIVNNVCELKEKNPSDKPKYTGV